jgi:hypothetical protein
VIPENTVLTALKDAGTHRASRQDSLLGRS